MSLRIVAVAGNNKTEEYIKDTLRHDVVQEKNTSYSIPFRDTENLLVS
jgi:hypothetical protein